MISSPNVVNAPQPDNPGSLFSQAFLQAEGIRAEKVKGMMSLLPQLIDRLGENALGGKTEAAKQAYGMIADIYSEAMGKSKEESLDLVKGMMSKIQPDLASTYEALYLSEIQGPKEQGRGQVPAQTQLPQQTPPVTNASQQLGGVKEATNVSSTETIQVPQTKVTYNQNPTDKLAANKSTTPTPTPQPTLNPNAQLKPTEQPPTPTPKSEAQTRQEIKDRLMKDPKYVPIRGESPAAYSNRINAAVEDELKRTSVRKSTQSDYQYATPQEVTYMVDKKVTTNYGEVTPAKEMDGSYYYEMKPERSLAPGKTSLTTFQNVMETTFGKKPDSKQLTSFISLLGTDEQNLHELVNNVIANDPAVAKKHTPESLMTLYKNDPGRMVMDFGKYWTKMSIIRMPNLTPNTVEGSTVVNSPNPKAAQEVAMTWQSLSQEVANYARQAQTLVQNDKSPTGTNVVLSNNPDTPILGAEKLKVMNDGLTRLTELSQTTSREQKDRAWALLGMADPGQTQFTTADVKRGLATVVGKFMGPEAVQIARLFNPTKSDQMLKLAELYQKDAQAAAEMANKLDVARIGAMANLQGTAGEVYRTNLDQLIKTYGNKTGAEIQKEYLKGGTAKTLIDNMEKATSLVFGDKIDMKKIYFEPKGLSWLDAWAKSLIFGDMAPGSSSTMPSTEFNTPITTGQETIDTSAADNYTAKLGIPSPTKGP